MAVITGRAFRTEIERHIIPFKVKKTQSGESLSFRRTISREEAETIIQSSHFLHHLSKIRAVNNVRLPIKRADGHIELLPEGYDAESMLYTMAGGPQIEDPGLDESCDLSGTTSSLNFVSVRKIGSAPFPSLYAAMLTLFTFNLIHRAAPRPGFLYTANAEGSGKTLLARTAIIPRCGMAPVSPLPQTEEELEKRILSSALAGAPVLFLDNGKRHVSSGALESALTAHFIQWPHSWPFA